MDNNNKINILPYSLGAAAVGAGVGAASQLVEKPYLVDDMPVGRFNRAIKQAFIDEGDKFVKNDENYNKVTSALKELKNINDKATLEEFIKSGKAGNIPKETKESIAKLIEKSDISGAKTCIELCLELDKEYTFKKAISATEYKSISNMIDNYKSYIDKLSETAKENINKAKNKMIRDKALFKAGEYGAELGIITAILLAVANSFKSNNNNT